MTGKLFCFGLGFSAQALARRLLAAGWQVVGTARAAEKRALLQSMGVEALPFDGLTPADFDGVTHILSAAPPREGDPVLAAYGGTIAGLKGLAWAGYLSTTGVYGDYRGAWVDETDPLRPSADRTWARVEAEQGWLDLWRKHGIPVHLFRLAGIYGPGRSVLDQVRNGTARPVVKRGQIFSRIHVDDIAAVLRASIATPNPGAIYNVADDKPCPQPEVVTYAYELLGLTAPEPVPFEEAQATMSEMGRSFWTDSKRVSNRRIKEELGVALRYPTYREGLAAVLESECRQNP